MKIPEFIPFKFDKFASNLFRKMGALGVGRWALLRKAVAETDGLFIDISDMIDRETLELDLGCTPNELTEFLEYCADRKAIDQELFHVGTIWICELDEDLTPFFRAGKRKIPTLPNKSRNFPIVDPQVTEFSETSQQVEEFSETLLANDGKFGHERTNERKERKERTNENAREGISIQSEITEWCRVFGSVGNRYDTEAAYLEAFQLLQNEGSPPKMAHEILKNGAAKDRAFCMATNRKRKDPHSWLKKRDWVRDYDQELKEHQNQDQKNIAKGGIQNGKSTRADEARAYTDAAKLHAEASGL
jgi:hypothetical protein